MEHEHEHEHGLLLEARRRFRLGNRTENSAKSQSSRDHDTQVEL